MQSTKERMKLNRNMMTRVKHFRSLEFSSSNGQRGEHLPIYGRDEGFLTPNFLKKKSLHVGWSVREQGVVQWTTFSLIASEQRPVFAGGLDAFSVTRTLSPSVPFHPLRFLRQRTKDRALETWLEPCGPTKSHLQRRKKAQVL